ncbi:cupredoxin domain-containing protein [Nannocystis sp. ILAH1]|uniref:cupredoxin domain-containing protein n=1 Tax=unclassified Nannocystis TaxID=2627009 RepID=UPI00226E4237|nr:MULTISPECIES: cupredoxin domain-containing protein [unclassified Nannocystis]MCY0986976.1 cupredoxin domain-containing protein [Nannocystis sp. ILAH1]MCY1071859.1 cupredoxin domain-containing protein [Nannocystis sp. RBIL2]
MSTVILPVVLSLGVTAVVGVLPAQADAATVAQAPAVREIEVIVDGDYRPGRITVAEGERVRLKFVRREQSPCTREVVFAALGIRRELPTDQSVILELPALSPGEYEFKCGMNMIRGVLEVVARKP